MKNNIVLYTTKEEAEQKTGYFEISSITITMELANIIYSYIFEYGLLVTRMPNQRKTSDNIYTHKFALKRYHNSNRAYLVSHDSRSRYRNSKKDETPSMNEMYFYITRKYPKHILGMSYYDSLDFFF